MLQEILNNVAKHAQATQVDIILDIDEDRLTLAVSENGIGISQERLESVHTPGLRRLKERASFFGGKVVFKTAQFKGPKMGAIAVVKVPIIFPLQRLYVAAPAQYYPHILQFFLFVNSYSENRYCLINTSDFSAMLLKHTRNKDIMNMDPAETFSL